MNHISIVDDVSTLSQATTIIVLPHDLEDYATQAPAWMSYALQLINAEKVTHYQTVSPEDGLQKVLWRPKHNLQRRLRHEAIEVVMQYKATWGEAIGIDVSAISDEAHACRIVKVISRAIGLSVYDVGHLKKDGDKKEATQLSVGLFHEKESTSAALEEGLELAGVMRAIMTLVDQPANVKTTHFMDSYYRDLGKTYGFDVDVIEKAQLEEMGWHSLLAVNRGSEDPAKCLIGSYGDAYHDAPLLLLVGKGVTFDTGGVSLKPGQNMHYMKSDMGGAAAVMGAISYAARMGVKIRIKALIPCTDNSIGTLAIKPGDVIDSYKGSTIEVINTDAEGRLILADALTYGIETYRPDYVVDLATLTGAAVRALGTEVAAFMSNDDAMATRIEDAAETSGEPVWRLPHYEEYGEMMKSDVADISNLSAKPVAGAITAGMFLKHFTNDHAHWAHFDIAGTAFGATPFAKGYSGTAYGVDLLVTFMKSL